MNEFYRLENGPVYLVETDRTREGFYEESLVPSITSNFRRTKPSANAE